MMMLASRLFLSSIAAAVQEASSSLVSPMATAAIAAEVAEVSGSSMSGPAFFLQTYQ